jgi:hypothetical protein
MQEMKSFPIESYLIRKKKDSLSNRITQTTFFKTIYSYWLTMDLFQKNRSIYYASLRPLNRTKLTMRVVLRLKFSIFKF